MAATRQEIDARLDHICIQSPEPRRLAAFFTRAYEMVESPAPGDRLLCAAPSRRVLIEHGALNKVGFVAFAFGDRERLGRYRAQVSAHASNLLSPPAALSGPAAFAVRDPDGNVVVFGESMVSAYPANRNALPARLQHVVFRSEHLDEMVEFYEHTLGFIVSDRVVDEGGVLRACFLRTDVEHHSLAVFRSPETRLDHVSFETTDWEHIRRWADDFAGKKIPIFWGVGRHGPGNDLFYMVKDPDDNLIEISAEIEQCSADRTTGIWPHAQSTLNVWGNAIMRS